MNKGIAMQAIFNRIHAQFVHLKAIHCSDVDWSFNEGASEQDFVKLEQILGFVLPDDFKEIYRIHDGSKNWFVLAGDDWLPIESIISEYQAWKRLYDEGCFQNDDGIDFGCVADDGIKENFWFNPRWLPFSKNACGDNKMIDLDPSDTGVAGQVIQMWHNDPGRERLAVSLKAFFEQYAKDLEDGCYVIHPEYEGLVRLDDLNDDELAQLGMTSD